MRKIATLALAALTTLTLFASATVAFGQSDTTCQSDPFSAACGAGEYSDAPIVLAQTYDIVDACADSRRGRRDSRCTSKVRACIANPFNDGCEAALDEHTDGNHRIAQVRFCARENQKNNASCKSVDAETMTSIRTEANAANWANSSNVNSEDEPDTSNVRNQFLLGDASGLDIGDFEELDYGDLFFDTETFDNHSLSDDFASGVAFFHGEYDDNEQMYAGIFSGTDLGAPIANDPTGKARWVGRFKSIGHSADTDFVLEVDFGTASTAGSIAAFVKQDESRHFLLTGSFDATGLISGTVESAQFARDDRDGARSGQVSGTLSGLIGQKGAVGAFYNNGEVAHYAGGFVARSPEDIEDFDANYFTNLCRGTPLNPGDPFHPHCHVGYEAERAARINQCIVGGFAVDNPELCGRAVKRNPCILNPFAETCELPAATQAQAKENRAQFCHDADNAAHSLCDETKRAGICGYDPFTSVCYDTTVSYEAARIRKYESCKNNLNNPTCNNAKNSPNSLAWENAEAVTVAARPTTSPNRKNEFLKGTQTGLVGTNTRGTRSGSLNFADAEFLGETLDGDEDSGVAFARTRISRKYNYYAGILSGTDLGGPVTASQTGSASWVGQFKTIGHYDIDSDFVLEIDFDENELQAFVKYEDYYEDDRYFHIDGSFSKGGLITGTIDLAHFPDHNSENKSESVLAGSVGGLIGRTSALGAFFSNGATNDSGSHAYSGGFIARQKTADDIANIEQECEEYPFSAVCGSGYEVEKAVRVGKCTDNSNIDDPDFCGGAINHTPCLKDPLAQGCSEFLTLYPSALSNRFTFCAENTESLLCEGYRNCNANPYSESCGFAAFDEARAIRAAFCVTDIENTLCTNFNFRCTLNPYDANCRHSIFDGARAEVASFCADDPNSPFCVQYKANCTANPFSVGCELDVFNAARATRIAHCALRANVDDPSCTRTLARPNVATWLQSFATELTDTPPGSLRASPFMIASETGLDHGTGTLQLAGSVNLGTASFDDVPLGGDAADGVAFMRVTVGGLDYYHAGLLSGTDLGAPLAQTSGTAKWSGEFHLITRYTTAGIDFILDVNFTDKTLKSDGILGVNTTSYLIDGRYDDKGVITGWVGSITDPRENVLTGLIGEQGAVGAYSRNNLFWALGGGFVASPTAVGIVKYNDWTRSFGTVAPRSTPNSTDVRNEFLAGTETGLDNGTLTINTAEPLTVLTLAHQTFSSAPGEAADGVAFFGSLTREHKTYYAGILSGTNLGAPITQNSRKALWNGWFQTIGTWDVSKQFDLEVNFAKKEVEAFVYHTGDKHYHLKGTFDRFGAIDGTVAYRGFYSKDKHRPITTSTALVYDGTLSGLIGQDGAIGAFIANPTEKDGHYSGGFVARNMPDAIVQYSDWTRSFGLTPLASAPPTTARKNTFLAGTATGIDNGDLVLPVWDNGVPSSGTLTLGRVAFGITTGDVADGVSFFTGRVEDAGTYYWHAGLLSGTNLGAPLTQTSGTARWNGRIQELNFSVNKNFTLEIDFAEKEVEAFVKRAGIFHFYLEGTFDDHGVIDGTVDLGYFTNSDRNQPVGFREPGVLTGLIGAEGAVGAFVSGAGQKRAVHRGTGGRGYAGGFVARPAPAARPNPDLVVQYSDLTSSFGATPPPNVPSTTNRANQFLAGTATGISNGDLVPPSDWAVASRGTLTLAHAVFGDTPGDAADGVAFFVGNVAGEDTYYYHGAVLSGTNLGAPVFQTSGTASWDGQFHALNHTINKAFALKIDFAEKEVEAFVERSFTEHFHLEGSFDDHGVIDGTVVYGSFFNSDRDALQGEGQPGVLTGLIGQQGAVGVFVSGTGPKHAIEGGTGHGYAGGFVARP